MTENIEIGGEVRPLNLGRNALREFEIITGKSIFNGSSIATMEAIQTLYFVGLKWGLYKGDGREPSPSFTLVKVGEWLDEATKDGDKMSGKIYEILTAALPKKEVAGENPAL